MAYVLQRVAMRLLSDVAYDLRHSVRALARSPGFTVVTVAVLALGIGATSAIFGLASAVWLKPLPFADAERLVTLWADLTPVGGPPRVEVAPGNYDDWQPRAQSFGSMTPIEPSSFNLTGDGGEPEQLAGVRTTANLFETIGLQPLLGRTFLPTDAAENAIVVGQGFWLRRLGGDANVVGRSITLDGTTYTIVGVVPRDFRFPNGEVDVFVPTVFTPEVLARRTSYYWYIVARLRAGVSTEAAQAEMNAIAIALESESPKTGRGVRASLVPLREQVARGVSLFTRCHFDARGAARRGGPCSSSRARTWRTSCSRVPRAAEGARDPQSARRGAGARAAAAVDGELGACSRERSGSG